MSQTRIPLIKGLIPVHTEFTDDYADIFEGVHRHEDVGRIYNCIPEKG